MNNDYDKEPDVIRLINELSNLRHQAGRSSTRIWTLKQLSLELSSYLPQVSDSTLFEIDDLIYGGVNTTVVAGTRIPSEGTVKLLVEKCYGIYHEFFFVERQEIGREAEMVFFQLLELVSDDICENAFFESQNSTLETLMTCSHTKHSIERDLKALKVAMNSHEKVFQHHVEELFDNDDFYAFISLPLVLSWTDESDYEHPTKKRWALWVSEQSSSLLEKMPLEKYHHRSDVVDYIRKCKQQKEIIYGWEYVMIVTLCYYHQSDGRQRFLFGNYESLFIHHLLKFFMSTQDNNQKIQRIYDYIQGLHLIARLMPTEIMKSDFYKNLEPIHDFTYSEIVVNNIYDIRCITILPNLNAKKRLMKAVRRYGYCGLSSYLPKESLPSSYITFKEKTNELMDKYFGDFDNFEVDETSGDEIEEISCFCDFIKGVQLMDIFHIAWIMLKDMIPTEYLHSCPYYESARLEVFRSRRRFYDILIEFNEYLEIYEDYSISFADQVLLRMCPFLVLSNYHDICHMEKLIKKLSGRNIGKANEEAIHFMLMQHNREG